MRILNQSRRHQRGIEAASVAQGHRHINIGQSRAVCRNEAIPLHGVERGQNRCVGYGIGAQLVGYHGGAKPGKIMFAHVKLRATAVLLMQHSRFFTPALTVRCQFAKGNSPLVRHLTRRRIN
jgi:hypothetical protein